MCLFSREGQRVNRNMHAAFGAAFKTNVAVNQREQRVVTTDANIQASLHLRAALTDDDVASDNLLATKFLDAKTTSGAVAPVAMNRQLSFVP